MSTSIELLEARIRAHPDDDEAWMVYGDWLLEQGDRRGELVMLEAWKAQRDEVTPREAAAAWVDSSRASWSPAALPLNVDYEWRRGFVWSATVRDILRRQHIRAIGQLLADPQARLLSGLRLRFAPLASASIVGRIAKLDLGRLHSFQAAYHPCGNELVQALLEQSSLSLTTLDLRYTGLTDSGLIELVGSTRLRGLRQLHLPHNALGNEGVEALASAPSMSELQVLDLRYNAIGREGVAALAKSPVLGKLTALLLYAGELDEESVRVLASSDVLAPNLVRFWRAQEQQRHR
jgi:uncharacterized protein (TIGR02996 family)